MRKVIKKLKSDTGATLMMALLFFVVCAVTGSMILVSATAASGRLEGMKRRDQNYYAVRSAVKLCEKQLEEMNKMDITFTDRLVETKTEIEDEENPDGSSSPTPPPPKYSIPPKVDEKNYIDEGLKAIDDESDIGYLTFKLVRDGDISNYDLKKANDGSSDKAEDVFNLPWFNKAIKEKAPVSSKETLHLRLSERNPNLSGLDVDIDIEINSTGVLTYRISNIDTIDGEENKEKYYMTLTADVEVPCEHYVDVLVDEDKGTNAEGHTITTTTTTTIYTNEYKFNFKKRDIKKG